MNLHVCGFIYMCVMHEQLQRVEERKCTFELLCKTLEQYVPLEAFKKDRGQTPWVLCPGSGLGRLPFEVITRGYSCQGNEFSYFMLLGSNFMLNHSLEAECFTLSPFVLATNNRVCDVDNLYTVTIPDVNVAAAKLSPDVDFSMCAGDFLDVYREQKAEWEAVLTCFFIDTAKNIILYIHTIANAIKPGGLWANVGPLLYHFADSPTEMSIELSYEEIRPSENLVVQSASEPLSVLSPRHPASFACLCVCIPCVSAMGCVYECSRQQILRNQRRKMGR